MPPSPPPSPPHLPSSPATATPGMELALTPQQHLCPLEALLSIYTPILECLVSHLPTTSKLALSQTSRSMRQLLHQYPRFFAHLDFRLSVFESPQFDTYPLGTVYNLDKLLQCLPVDSRIVSLTLDWTAVSGSFLFNKILDRCSQTLEHLSVRGCRKVSIKHHIVPHFVYQSSIFPLGDHGRDQKAPALKSLYVYKARGVRRKPFLIDRKPADGDEPSRYLTTLAASLGIWVDLGLCPTPKLRCPRRREILRRGKENFCVPFDKRWRVQDDNEMLSEVEHNRRRAREQSYGEGMECWNCAAEIPDRCEACVHQMTCTSCQKPLCHDCAYFSRSAVPPVVPHPPPDQDETFEAELNSIRSKLLIPCCRTAPVTHADNLCAPCYEQMQRAACSLCDRPICIKHELERCRRCEGGCDRLFCFSSNDNGSGCGEPESGRAGMKDCIGCGMEVCATCRSAFQMQSQSPVPSDDDCCSDAGLQQPQKTSCACRVCIDNYYCPGCWPTKSIPCEPRPTAIIRQESVLDGAVTLLQIAFEDPNEPPRWFTPAAMQEQHPALWPSIWEEFHTRARMKAASITPPPPPSSSPATSSPATAEIPPDWQPTVAASEWILERVLAVKPGLEGANSWHPPPPATEDGADDALVLCKWLGKTSADASWERYGFFTSGRERDLVERFVLERLTDGGGEAGKVVQGAEGGAGAVLATTTAEGGMLI